MQITQKLITAGVTIAMLSSIFVGPALAGNDDHAHNSKNYNSRDYDNDSDNNTYYYSYNQSPGWRNYCQQYDRNLYQYWNRYSKDYDHDGDIDQPFSTWLSNWVNQNRNNQTIMICNSMWPSMNPW